MKFRDRYGFNKDLAENGAWVDRGGGFEIKVRRLNAKAVRELNERLLKPHRHLMRGGKPLPNDLAEEVNRRLTSEAILLGWRGEGGPVDDNGVLIPWTPDAAYEAFVAAPDFLDDVITSADELENFRSEEIKETEGN